MGADPQTERWHLYLADLQDRPDASFTEQEDRFNSIFDNRDPALPPPPIWIPDADRLINSNLGHLMQELGFETYRELHSWSTRQRGDFWRRAVDRLGIIFSRQPERILDHSGGTTHPVWLPGAQLNIVDSCFQAEGDRVAVALGGEGSDGIQTHTYGELETLVNRIANGLLKHGFAAGDAIALYMPMNLECVAAYLAIIRSGCVVVSIADSFAPPEVSRRLEIAAAVGVITVDNFSRGGRTISLYDKVRAAGAPRTVVIQAGGGAAIDLRDGDLLWRDLLSDDPSFESVPAPPTGITNVLFSSGTTGDPKAIPWTQLTPIKCAVDGHFHQDIHPGNVLAWPTNIGWMMGPWLIYAALINRACIALFEGLPTGRDFTEFVQNAGVTMLGVVPSLVRAWRESGACEGTDWTGIRVFSSTGEPSNRVDSLWLMSRAGYQAPIIEYCGGTEIGGGHLTGTVVQPASPAAFSTPALGLDLVVLDDNGQIVEVGSEGEVFLVPPSIGLSQSLLNRDHDSIYYADCPTGLQGEALRRHGDQVARLPGGYFRAQGRADDTMNLGGIKVSSLELERVVEQHPAVFEAAAVAVQPDGEGAEALVIFVVLSAATDADDLQRDLGRAITKELNPLFKIHDLVVVESLPRTASNKLMRRLLRKQYAR